MDNNSTDLILEVSNKREKMENSVRNNIIYSGCTSTFYIHLQTNEENSVRCTPKMVCLACLLPCVIANCMKRT